MLKGRVVFRFGVSLSVVMVAGLAAMWWLASSGATGGTRWSVGLGLVALVVASGVWLGTRLLRPVDDLQRDAERLLRGWGDAPAADDEFGTLKQAVAYIASHPRERFQVLETERATIAAILDSMTEGVMALDEPRRVVFMNHAARTMLDCAHDPVEGRDLLEVARDQGLTELVEWCRVPNATMPRKRDIERSAPFRKTIEIHARPVPLSAQASGTVLVLRDVTELRRLERVRAEFVVNVSHELRTPLTAIKGYVETLLDDASSESATPLVKHAPGAPCDQGARGMHRRFLEVAHSHVERMGRLLDDLRNLSDIEMGHVVLDPVPLGLGDVVSEVSAMFEKDAAKKGVVLLNQVASRCRVRADRDLLVQILVNLVDNAVKYTPRGGRVTFQAGQEDDRHLRITVRDTGHGIPRADVPRVTERFYRVEKARSREAGGTGLGLAIVKHLVQLHGGTLHIDSEYGKGTTIGFRLPAA